MTLRTIVLCCFCLAYCSAAAGGDRYAIVVTGASGGETYARQYDAWRERFITALRGSLGYPADHVYVLAEKEAPGVAKATRENVRSAITDVVRRASRDDLVLVLLIGHGTGVDGDEAKFNLVGPDLSAREWAAMLGPFAGRLVFIDTASGSFPFLSALSRRGRIVVTANNSPAQQFETVFPGFLVDAFADLTADLDRNGKVSIWEAFTAASDAVGRWFESRTQLATERPLLDDTGDGTGREADDPGPHGLLAQVTYLQYDRPIVETGDSERTALVRRRAQLESDLEALRARKPDMRADEYEAALERLLLEVAGIDRRLRSKS